MARVPYDPVRSVSPPLVPADAGYQSANTNADMFGAAQGRALQQAGAQIGQAADKLSDYVLREQGIVNETMAKEALLSATDQYSQARADYLAKTGKDAEVALPDYQKRLDEIREGVLSQLPNPAVRRMVEFQIASGAIQNREAGVLHARKQVETWRKETASGMVSAAYSQGMQNADDPGKLESFANTMASNIRQRFSGHAPEFVEAKVAEGLGDYYKTAIDGLLLRDPLKAKAVFEQVRGRLDGPAQIQIERALEVAVSRVQGEQLVAEATRQQSPPVQGFHPRARQAFDYFVSQGRTPQEAAAAAAQFQHESSFNERASHDGGIGTGILGWNKDRRQALEAKYGPSPTFEQQLEFFNDEFFQGRGDPGAARAGQMGSRARTAREAAEIFTREGVRPADIPGQSRARGETAEKMLAAFTAQQTEGTLSPPAPIDYAKVTQFIMERTEGNPRVRDAALSAMTKAKTLQDHMLEGERFALANQVKNLEGALRAGHTAEIPSAAIQRLYPEQKATAIIRELEAAQEAGGIVRNMQFASPADLASVDAELAERERTQAGMADGQYLNVAQTRKQFNIWRQNRAEQLKNDPAGYTFQEPSVKAAYEEVRAAPDNLKLAKYQEYLQKLIAAQTVMGVPNPRVLGNSQITGMVDAMAKATPESGKMLPTLRGFAEQYGSYWNQAFGELVKHGKVDAGYQFLATMDTTEQVLAARDYQAMLGQLSGEDGHKKMVAAARARVGNPTIERNVRESTDSALDDFARVYAPLRGSAALISMARENVENLALFYVQRDGLSHGAAVKKAADGLINSKWGISGTMIYPKKREAEVFAATYAIQRDLTREEIALPASVVEIPRVVTGDMDSYMRAVKDSGRWLPTNGTDGLVLAVQDRNGAWLPVKRADGSDVVWRFTDPVPAGAADPRLRQVPAVMEGMRGAPRLFTVPGQGAP